VSAGESDVSNAVMEDVGEALLRIFDLVERNFRLILCGMNEGNEERSFEAVVAASRSSP